MDKKETILQEITAIFRKELGDDTLEITYSSSAQTIEKWDSITNLVLLSAIEEKYGIVFPIEFIFTAENVGHLCDYILGNSTL